MPAKSISITLVTLLATTATQLTFHLPDLLATPTSVQTQGSPKEQAGSLFQLGLEEYQQSQFEAAIKSWQQALMLYQRLQNRHQEMTVLGNLGAAYLQLGDNHMAIQFSQQFLTLAQAIGDRTSESQALGNLAIGYKGIGEYIKAIDYHHQALKIMQELGNHQGEGQLLRNLATAYETLGRYEEAIESLEKSLTLTQKLNDRTGEAIILGNLGAIYAKSSKYDQAIDFYQQSLAITQAIGNRQVTGYILNNLGSFYHVQGKIDQAIAFYKQSLAIAQTIGDRKLEGEAQIHLGTAYEELADYNKAIEHYNQSLTIFRSIAAVREAAMTLNNLAHTLIASGNFPEAEQNLREAIKILDDLRNQKNLDDTSQISLFDTQVFTYNLLQQVLIAQNQPEKALEMSEHGRTRPFITLLAQRLFSPTEALSSAKPPTLEQIREIAQAKNATLVEYSLIPKDDFIHQGKLRGSAGKLFIWVIQPTGQVTSRQVDLKALKPSLEELVTVSRQSIGAGGRGSITIQPLEAKEQAKPLKQLHTLLIDPITDLLPSDPNAHVIFIPQGELFLVPFPALQDENSKYLIEKHTIITAPAIQVLELTQRQSVKVQEAFPQGTLIVGNPTMPQVTVKIGEPPVQLKPLPAAEQEAIAIAQLLNAKALIGQQATKSAILPQLSQAKIVHLATHGLLDDVQGVGIPGAIALAPSGNDNGLLTANEIFDLKLKAELVILSACDTGRGRITGDGVIGLSRSLITAGVPSVIVSLWSVPDAPTATLMTEFYRNWQDQKLDKAQALRQAMLKTMKTHPNPRNWAAFTLIGEAE